jgi:hypothetical protein
MVQKVAPKAGGNLVFMQELLARSRKKTAPEKQRAVWCIQNKKTIK